MLFRIQPVEGRGNGVVATSNITKGARIHAESPFITLPSLDDAPNPQALSELVLQQLRSATRDEQRAFFSLTNIHGNNMPIILGVVQTNALAFGPGGEGGVFLTGSQFNHNCLPSACSKWNSDLGMMTVHALRDIEEGEEITITYINFETHDVRQKTLYDGFQFICTCETCTLPQDMVNEMDADIQEIKNIDLHLKSSNLPLDESLGLAYRQRYLIESKSLDLAHAPDTYDLVAKLAAIRQDYTRAKIFSERHLAVVMTEGGPDHPDTKRQQEMDDYLASILEKHYGPRIPYHFPLFEVESWLWMQHQLPPEVYEGEGESEEGDSQDTTDESGYDGSSEEEQGVWSADENDTFDVEALD
ncbi:hypothetical protein PG989_011811 [Apiospora arundinis]